MALLDWPLRWRDRLLASERFHAFAARTPIFRSIARRRTADLFDIASGFVKSQTLFACIELGVLDLLKAGPLSLADIAARTGLSVTSTEKLAKAAASCGLLVLRKDKVSLGILGASVHGAPGVKAMVRHNQAFYRDLADPVAVLRREASPEIRRFWPYAGAAGHAAGHSKADEERSAAYTDLMAQSQGMLANDVLDAVDLRGHHHIMDVGGGDGTFLRHVAKRHPHLAMTLVDLPEVAAIARIRFAAGGLERRVTVHGADFGCDPLPVGPDLITLVRIVHDHDDPAVMTLFRAAFTALPPGGTLLIAEPMSGVPGAEAMADAYFGFYFLAMGAGEARAPQRLSAMLAEVGFGPATFYPTHRPLMASVVLAKKPAK